MSNPDSDGEWKIGEAIITPFDDVGEVAVTYGDGTVTVKVGKHFETYFNHQLKVKR